MGHNLIYVHIYIFYWNIYFKDFIYFRDSGKEGEREGEKHQGENQESVCFLWRSKHSSNNHKNTFHIHDSASVLLICLVYFLYWIIGQLWVWVSLCVGSLKGTAWGSYGQDRGVGRNTSLPNTTKRRITTNFKIKNNQNCPKIKLHGAPTTKELKKHSSRLVGGAKKGSQAERTHGESVACGPGN